MGVLMLLCGMPGSGKSTHAASLVANGWTQLNADDIMLEKGISLWDSDSRHEIEQELISSIPQLLTDRDVVVDFGLWSKQEREDLRLIGEQHGEAVGLTLLDTPLEVCWKRVQRRNMEVLGSSRAITWEEMVAIEQLFQKPNENELQHYYVVVGISPD